MRGMPDGLAGFSAALEDEIRRAIDLASSGPPEWADAVGCARRLVLSGGKRLRPRLCAMAYMAAGGDRAGPGLVRFAAGIELLHTCMLVHDDVMDRSSVRRGQPAVHRGILELGVLDDERLADGMAIVVGDVLAVLATEELVPADVEPARARRASAAVHLAMRETGAGQLLDLVHTARPIEDVSEEQILEAYRLKTAHFAFAAPLRAGAILAGAEDEDEEALVGFGLRVGTAFQLRDDLVGLLGRQSLTGKRAEDDLREGKKTLVLRLLWDRCDRADRDLLDDLLGRREPSAEEFERVRRAASATGAVDQVEDRIAALSREALQSLGSASLVESWRAQLALLTAWLERREM